MGTRANGTGADRLAGGLGAIKFLGETFALDRTVCAKCRRPVLMITAAHRRPALYDRIEIVAAEAGGNPQGKRHDCRVPGDRR